MSDLRQVLEAQATALGRGTFVALDDCVVVSDLAIIEAWANGEAIDLDAAASLGENVDRRTVVLFPSPGVHR